MGNKRYQPEDRKAVTFWLPAELKDKVTAYCRKHNLSLTQFLTIAVERAMDMGVTSSLTPSTATRSLTGIGDELNRLIQIRDELMTLERRGKTLLEEFQEQNFGDIDVITQRFTLLKQDLMNDVRDELLRESKIMIQKEVRIILDRELGSANGTYYKIARDNLVEELKDILEADLQRKLQQIIPRLKDKVLAEIS